MKRKQVFMSLVLAMLALSVAFNGCKKDDEPKELKLETLVSGTIDLNAAVSATGVPVLPTIVATFNVNIDPASATAANITLTQNYDNADIALNITVSGKTITIVPTAALGTGTLYDLKLKAGLKSTDDKFLTEVSRNFTTEGTFAPSGVIAHWKFEDNANDAVGTFNPNANGVVAINYVASRNAAAGKAASFNGTTSIIEIPNAHLLMNTANFTLSFWVRAETQDKGHFVMGLGAFYGFQFEIFGGMGGCKLAAQYEHGDGSTSAEDLWFPADGNVSWQGWTFCKDLTSSGGLPALLENKWAHIVCTYNAATREGKMFINGELMKAQDFDLWPEDSPKRTVKGLKYAGVEPDVKNELAFGFIQSRAGTMWANEPWGGYQFPGANHFKGQLDDIRIFHKALTPVEIQLMYNSEKP